MVNADPIDMQTKILQEATRLFVERGYLGISMREIAEAVGVSKAGLYYHFRDKEELFIAILTDCINRLEHAIATSLPTEPGVRGEIGAILKAIFAQPPVQRAVMRLANSELTLLSEEARTTFGRRYYEQFISRIETALRRGISAGELRAINPHETTWFLLGMAYPFFTPNNNRSETEIEALVASILTIFFEGASYR